MKVFSTLLIAILSCTSLFAQDSTSTQQVKVYYFHTSYRCINCTNFENWTREVVKTRFQDEIDKELISFHSVNIEEKANQHYVEEYQLFTKSVVLSKSINGKELKWKNLDQIWMKARNEKKFKDYIETEIKLMLGDKSS